MSDWTSIELPTGTLSVQESAGNPFSLHELIQYGARNNPKRGFLFVSTVLGKHLPTRPSRMAAMHRFLAGRIQAAPAAPVVLIGMAETAVGLGYGVFEAWKQAQPQGEALFLHSTRYPLAQEEALTFEESHCHAPNQFLHLPRHGAQRDRLQRAKTLVLIDDEASTGQTFGHLWQALHAHMPQVERIVILTLTDFMHDHARQTLCQRLGMSASLQVDFVSAARAQWRFSPKAWTADANGACAPAMSAPPQVLTHLGRIGLSQPITVPFALRAQVERLLVDHPRQAPLRILGSGEFMHAPYALAHWLEQQGYNVSYQSSTRSPILHFGAISHRQTLPDPYGRGDAYFIYNAAPSAELTLMIHETPPHAAIEESVQQLNAHPLAWPAADESPALEDSSHENLVIS